MHQEVMKTKHFNRILVLGNKIKTAIKQLQDQ